MNKQSTYIVISILIFSLLVNLTDAVVHPDYFVKIPIKILFFLVFPVIFFAANKKDFDGFKRLFIFKKSGILKPLLLGAAIYTVIILGYFSTRKIIDFSNVTSNLTEGMGITANRFIYVSCLPGSRRPVRSYGSPQSRRCGRPAAGPAAPGAKPPPGPRSFRRR